MNKVLKLTKIMLKSSFNINKRSALIGFIVILSMLPLSVLVWGAVWEGYDIMAPLGQQGMILWMIVSIIGAAIFFFGIFFIMSVFYFSKDVEMLLPLPLKPWQILGAKFINVLIYEYGIQSIFFLPAAIAYGIKDGGGLLYFVSGIVAFFILPVAPLVFASFINILIMRSFNFVKNKDRMKLIASIAAMILAIGFNLLMQNASQTITNPDEILELIEKGNDSLLGKASDIFIINRFAVLAMVKHKDILFCVRNILIALAGGVVFVLIFLYLGEKFYIKGVVGMSEASAGRKKPKAGDYKKAYKRRSRLHSYRLKELKLLFRSPVYFINCVMMNFLWPVFLIIPIFAGGQQLEALGDMRALGNDPTKASLIIGAAAGISMFVASSNMISSTAISREGSNIYVAKYLPISYKDQINAKVQSGIILGLSGIIVALGAAKFLLSLPIYLLVAAFILSIPCIVFVNYTGILIDLKFPKLHWDNEQKAVKQNFNGVLNMMIGIAGAALNIGLTVYFKPEFWSTFFALMIVYILADIALYNTVKSYGSKLFAHIQ